MPRHAPGDQGAIGQFCVVAIAATVRSDGVFSDYVWRYPKMFTSENDRCDQENGTTYVGAIIIKGLLSFVGSSKNRFGGLHN
jgi:hypothetical protein